MIQSFTIINHLGDVLVLELASPEKSGLLVDSVTGLGQVGANINSSKIAGSDYSVVNSAYLGERNIVFKIKYVGYDAEEDEDLTDKMFPTKTTVSIICKTDLVEVYTQGTVEKNEPTIFSDKPDGAGCQISIMCPDPYWYELDNITTPFGGIEPLFEFPFHSDIEGFGDDKIEFGNIRVIKEKSIYYTGEADEGITISVHALGQVRDLVFYNLDQRKQLPVSDSIITDITGSGIVQGDNIVISSVRGNKYATLTRNGVTYNIINALAVNKIIQWFELVRGNNLLAYSATTGEYDMIINIKHRIAYKGI